MNHWVRRAKCASLWLASALDYLHGERPNWHRQILFVKDRDPLGPNYFVIRDTLGNARAQGLRGLLPSPLRPGPDWRVWIATDAISGTSSTHAQLHLPTLNYQLSTPQPPSASPAVSAWT